MSRADDHGLEHHARRILVLQGGLTVFLALLILLFGQQAGSAAGVVGMNVVAGMFGGLLGMLGTLVSSRSAHRSGKAVLKAPQFAMVPVYLGLLNRLLVVGGGLALGMVLLEFGPIYIVSGFLVSQLAPAWVLVKRA